MPLLKILVYVAITDIRCRALSFTPSKLFLLQNPISVKTLLYYYMIRRTKKPARITSNLNWFILILSYIIPSYKPT